MRVVSNATPKLSLTALFAVSTLLSMTTWSTIDIPDLTGPSVVVTGANSGIGRAAAQALAAAGARVVLAVRDTNKGEAAAAAMPGTTEVRRLDLASLESIRAFAADWRGGARPLVQKTRGLAPPPTRPPGRVRAP